METAPTPSRMTDRKRAEILDAAIVEFRQSGYEATSMDRVASSAGVSKRTVYNHFPSKEVLFAQILQLLWERSAAGLDLAYRTDRPLRLQLLELVAQKFRLLHDPNFVDLARVLIAAGIHSPERVQEMVARMGDREEGLTVWIRAAVADGRLKAKESAFASLQLQALIKGFAFWPQITLGQPQLTPSEQKRVAEASVDMFLAQYG